MQYLAGLRDLGHDVVYMEDCGAESWVYDWEAEQLTDDLNFPAGYIDESLRTIEFSGSWIYRAGDDCRGLPLAQFKKLCTQADLMIVWAVPISPWREEYQFTRRRAFIDADPGFTQISLANGDAALAETTARCDALFTIGQRIGDPDCTIPTAGLSWEKTLPPVNLAHWPAMPEDDPTHFTTIMQWRGFKEVEYGGLRYGQKDLEFPKFIDLPTETRQPLRIALTGSGPELLAKHGWSVVSGWQASRTPQSYREFIQQSRAELCVAKQGYVQMRGGWFSDRSVCYLASGRPVLVQDTGLADWLAVGEGVLTFRDLPEALAGIEAINADYHSHCAAARRIAEKYFATKRVLPPLIETATR
jgi:hypothetical protein